MSAIDGLSQQHASDLAGLIFGQFAEGPVILDETITIVIPRHEFAVEGIEKPLRPKT